jgi:ribose transport system substrate-binding protein
MKHILPVVILFLSCTYLVSVARTDTPGKKSKPVIAVIPKGTTHVFWKSIHAGARKAAQECGTEIIWQGPQKEDDRKMQIELVQNFISRGVDAIVLAPLDEVALIRPVHAAVKRKIKVIIIDSGLKSDIYTSFAATDNYKGGKLAAQHLAKLLKGKGNVMMMRYAEGSASTMKREQGFLDGMKEYAPEAKLVSINQHGGVTAESAFQVAQNLLNKYKDLDGIFCPNESTTFGMLRALQTSGRAGKITFMGFDTSESLINALKKDELNGLILQDPFKMGYLGVKTAVDALQGKKVEKRIDTGVTLVTKKNLDEPAIQKLVNPKI